MSRKLLLKVIRLCAVIIAASGMLSVQYSAAQTVGGRLQGKVVDEANHPVIGATVVVKDTNIGVTTAADGTFSLSGLKTGNVIEVSFLGSPT